MIFTIYGIRATGKIVPRSTFVPFKEDEHDFSGSDLRFSRPGRSGRRDVATPCREFEKSPVDLLVLPELAGVDSFWTSPTFDEAVWRQAVAIHAKLEEHLRPIPAKRIAGTRAIAEGEKRWNETYLWTPERGLVRGRAKALLPQQEGGWRNLV